MSRTFNRLAALFVLACTVPLANAAPYGPGGPGGPGSHREYREAQRLESYSRDVLRNNRKECSDIRSVREQRDGQITVECLSNNKRRELRYEITPTRGNRGARVVLLSEQRNTPHRDGHRRDYR